MNYFLPLIFKFLGLLPLAASRALGTLVGSISWLQQGKAARTTLENLAHCFPEMSEQERTALAKQSLTETAKTAAEAGAIWRHSWSWLDKRIVAKEGDDLLRAKLAEGKGVLVLAPHHGNWEVVAPYLASVAQLTAMYQPHKFPKLDQLILEGRSKLNISMAPTNRKGVLMLVRSLQTGGIVGILPDQVPDKTAGRELAPFFNQPAQTMTLVQGLIQRSGCAVCSCYAERVAGGFKIVVMEAAADIYADETAKSLTGLNASVEACVRRAPAQYQWEYRRFKELPPELPSPYRRNQPRA